MAHRYLWIAYHNLNMYDKASAEAREYFAALGKLEIADLIGLKYNDLGYQGVMNLLAIQLENKSKESFVQPIWIARLYAYSGNIKKTLSWLEVCYRERDPLMVNINASRDWDNIRNTPGYKKLCNKMDLVS